MLRLQAMDASETKKFLIDGFPRNEDNLSGWNKEMEGVADVKCVLFFDCSQQVLLDIPSTTTCARVHTYIWYEYVVPVLHYHPAPLHAQPHLLYSMCLITATSLGLYGESPGKGTERRQHGIV